MKQPSKQNKLTRVSRKIESLKSKLSNPDTASSKVNALSAELKANKKKLKNLKGAGAGIVTYTGPRKKGFEKWKQQRANDLASVWNDTYVSKKKK